MDIREDGEYNKDLLADDETWLIFLEPAFCNDPTGSDALAHLLFTLKEAIESGPDGTKQAVNTLLDGIRLVYQFTEEHKLALKLYRLYLTGHLKHQDEPRILLNGAIERGLVEVGQAYKKSDAAKDKRIGKRRNRKKKRCDQ